MSTPITAREFFAGIPANTPPYIPELHQDDCEDTNCTRCVETVPTAYTHTGDGITIALPAQWECAYGPFDDEAFCQEAEDESHKCPIIRVHIADSEAFSALVDKVHELEKHVADLKNVGRCSFNADDDTRCTLPCCHTGDCIPSRRA